MEEGVGEAGGENNLVDLVGLGDRGGGGDGYQPGRKPHSENIWPQLISTELFSNSM